MTREDVHFLDNTKLYEFRLYNGVIKVGYITQDYELEKYFIVFPNQENRNRPAREVGFPVKLDQIVFWDIYIPESIRNTNTYLIKGNTKAKKMIILGAGASYDYSYDLPTKEKINVPLTRDLFSDSFEEILRKYPGAADLSSEISLLINAGGDLESYFENQWKKIETDYNPVLLNKLINTQYYIHELFKTKSDEAGGIRKSNYYNLVKLAHDYSIANSGEVIPFVTFNYDTLLEQSIERHYSTKFYDISDYTDIDKRTLLVFKPHGSANWAKKFKLGLCSANYLKNNVHTIDALASTLYRERKSLLEINNHIHGPITLDIRNPNPSVKNNEYYNYYYPWLLIPYKNKDEFMMPEQHEVVLEHAMDSVSELLIIGWKGTEHKFQSLMKRKLGNRTIKITLIEPDDQARQAFMSGYSKILPNVQYDTTDIRHLRNFTGYMTYSTTASNHFFN